MPPSNSSPQIKRRRVIFALEAPDAAQVALLGEFNAWNPKAHPMKRDYSGVWKKIVMLPPGRYEYRFLVDGQWRCDPRNSDICSNCFGTQNNVLVVAPPG